MPKILKCALVVLVGFSPLLLGFILNHLMMTFFLNDMLPEGSMLIGVGVIVAWFFLGALSAKFLGNKKQALILLNAPALLFLLIIFFWMPIFGILLGDNIWVVEVFWVAAQVFYLPTLRLSAIIGWILPPMFTLVITFMFTMVITFVMKVGSSALGIKLLGGGRTI